MIKIIDLEMKIYSHLGYLNDYVDEIIDYYQGNNEDLNEEDIIYDLDDIKSFLKVLEEDIVALEEEYDSIINK